MLDHHYGQRELTISYINTLSEFKATSYNMALRTENQPMSGIPIFWQDPSTEIQQQWSRWIELFEATHAEILNINRRIDKRRSRNS